MVCRFKKNISLKNLYSDIFPVDYLEDKKGFLIVGNEKETIRSAVKMPNSQLEEVIKELQTQIVKVRKSRNNPENKMIISGFYNFLIWKESKIQLRKLILKTPSHAFKHSIRIAVYKVMIQ